MLPYLSALENVIVFQGALEMTRFTYFTLYGHADRWVRLPAWSFLLAFYILSIIALKCGVFELVARDRRTDSSFA